ELERVKVNDAPGPVPSARAIRRVKTEFESLKAEDMERYKRFLWPESMQRGILPWESSRAALDLLRYYRDRGMHAPLIEEVQTLWHVTLAAPDMSLDDRVRIAAQLLASVGRPKNFRIIETALAYQRRPEKGLSFDPRPGGIYLIKTFFELAKG